MTVPTLDFYCDETSHVGHRFAAVSGILVRPQRVGALCAELEALKIARHKSPTSELKWEKINKRDKPLYLDLVAHFFSLLEANLINYHVIICDFHEYDHRKFTQGEKHVSVSKTYYQLLLHRCCKIYADRAQIHVWPDSGECTADLPKYLDALRADERSRFQPSQPTIRSINPVSSTPHGIMHMNDVVLGAIASHRNGRHLAPEASPHKTQVAAAVLDGFGLRSFSFNSPIKGRFTVWNWRPPAGRLRS
jgi:hypothetical protein